MSSEGDNNQTTTEIGWQILVNNFGKQQHVTCLKRRQELQAKTSFWVLYQLIKYNFHLEANTSSCQGGKKNKGTIAQNKIEEPWERWVIDYGLHTCSVKLQFASLFCVSHFLNLKCVCSFYSWRLLNFWNYLQFQVTSRKILYSICIQNHLNSICIY